MRKGNRFFIYASACLVFIALVALAQIGGCRKDTPERAAARALSGNFQLDVFLDFSTSAKEADYENNIRLLESFLEDLQERKRVKLIDVTVYAFRKDPPTRLWGGHIHEIEDIWPTMDKIRNDPAFEGRGTWFSPVFEMIRDNHNEMTRIGKKYSAVILTDGEIWRDDIEPCRTLASSMADLNIPIWMTPVITKWGISENTKRILKPMLEKGLVVSIADESIGSEQFTRLILALGDNR